MARFDTNGNHAWSKSFNGSLGGGATNVVVDLLGNIIIIGSFNGAVDLGNGILTSTGDCDAYLAKYNVVGEPLWSYQHGSAGFSSVLIDTTGNIVLAGGMSGEVDFGGGFLPFAGDSDVFLAKLSAEGSHQWM